MLQQMKKSVFEANRLLKDGDRIVRNRSANKA